MANSLQELKQGNQTKADDYLLLAIHFGFRSMDQFPTCPLEISRAEEATFGLEAYCGRLIEFVHGNRT